MKLKAPQGTGDPCVAGVTIEARNGVYEVEAEIGALLIECFGFVGIALETKADVAPAGALSPPSSSPPSPSIPPPRAPRRRRPAVKKT